MARREDYKRNSTGQLEKFVDFRTTSEREEQPRVDSGHLWTDPDFGMRDAIQGTPLINALNRRLDWKRPKEIRENPKLYTGGRTRYDVGQGEAGTCWFLAAVSTIANKKAMLDKVIPPGGYSLGTDSYDGKFHARFWQFGEWEDVYVDDCLPVIYGDVIWGAHSASDKDEMWISLLEKAFAKHHGSYNAIFGGQGGSAYVALTGGMAENIKHEEMADKNALYSRLSNAINSGSQVISSVPKRFDGAHGLQGAHAYSMSGVATVKGEKLLRLRNPWGNEKEWTGRWSDGSYTWRGVPESEVPHADKEDGEFWMSYQDFLTYFDETEVCSLTPDFNQDGRTDGLDYVLNMYGQWIGSTAAGFDNKLRNPAYLVSVPDTPPGDVVPVVVQLIQKRKSRKDKTDQIRCDVFQVLDGKDQKVVLENMAEKTNDYNNNAQRSFRFLLKGGNYCIVPSTADEGIEREFLIRVFSPVPLGNVSQMDRGKKLMASELQSSLEYDGRDYQLSFSKIEFGSWRNIDGNTGGHIGFNKTHDSNPQYLVTVTQDEALIMFRVLQVRDRQPMPVGLWLYEVDPREKIPLSYEQIYDKHKGRVNMVMTTVDGEDNKYVRHYDFHATYLLPKGQYLLLVHTDGQGREGDFTLLIKSTGHLGIRGYQTGV